MSTKAYQFDGKVAVVTGAARGIGAEITKRLLDLGARVVLADRSENVADTARQLAGLGAGTDSLVFDVTDSAAVDNAVGTVIKKHGKVDILVANAGVLGVISPVGHIEAKVFERVMNINVTATWRLIRSVEPLLLKSDAGRALILSSGAAHSCRPFWGVYSTSKAAVEALARTQRAR